VVLAALDHHSFQDDYRTARINTAFVLSWLEAFPEYAALPMFLVGESYAGVYMPMLFEGLLNSSSPPNLVGLGMSLTPATFPLQQGCLLG
jgi:carboxypeptidase C (cathepsin A)